MPLLNSEQVLKLLTREVKRAGGQVAWAKKHGLHSTTVNKTLRKQRPLTPSIIGALKVKKVTAYQRAR